MTVAELIKLLVDMPMDARIVNASDEVDDELFYAERVEQHWHKNGTALVVITHDFGTVDEE